MRLLFLTQTLGRKKILKMNKLWPKKASGNLSFSAKKLVDDELMEGFLLSLRELVCSLNLLHLFAGANPEYGSTSPHRRFS